MDRWTGSAMPFAFAILLVLHAWGTNGAPGNTAEERCAVLPGDCSMRAAAERFDKMFLRAYETAPPSIFVPGVGLREACSGEFDGLLLQHATGGMIGRLDCRPAFSDRPLLCHSVPPFGVCSALTPGAIYRVWTQKDVDDLAVDPICSKEPEAGATGTANLRAGGETTTKWVRCLGKGTQGPDPSFLGLMALEVGPGAIDRAIDTGGWWFCAAKYPPVSECGRMPGNGPSIEQLSTPRH